jgi:hypothetical protein
MVPDVAAPAPEIEALCTLVASDLRQVGEIIRRDAQAHYFSAGARFSATPGLVCERT